MDKYIFRCLEYIESLVLKKRGNKKCGIERMNGQKA